MDAQLTVTLMLVAAAGTYLLRAALRTWFPPAGNCGGGCGCKSADRVENLITDLTVRHRGGRSTH